MRYASMLVFAAGATIASRAWSQECGAVILIDHGQSIIDVRSDPESNARHDQVHDAVSQQADQAFEDMEGNITLSSGLLCYVRHYALYGANRVEDVIAHAQKITQSTTNLRMKWYQGFKSWTVRNGAPWVFIRIEPDWVRKRSDPAVSVRRSVAQSDGTLRDDFSTFFPDVPLAFDWRFWALLVSSPSGVQGSGTLSSALEIAPGLRCGEAKGGEVRCKKKDSLVYTIKQNNPEFIPEIIAAPVVEALRNVAWIRDAAEADPEVLITARGNRFVRTPLATAARNLIAARIPLPECDFEFEWPKTELVGARALKATHGSSWSYQVGNVRAPSGSWPLLVRPFDLSAVRVTQREGGTLEGVLQATNHLYFIPGSFDEVRVRGTVGLRQQFYCRKDTARCPPRDRDVIKEVMPSSDDNAAACICLRPSKVGDLPAYQFKDAKSEDWFFVWKVPGVRARPVPGTNCGKEQGGWRCPTAVSVSGEELPMCPRSVRCEEP